MRAFDLIRPKLALAACLLLTVSSAACGGSTASSNPTPAALSTESTSPVLESPTDEPAGPTDLSRSPTSAHSATGGRGSTSGPTAKPTPKPTAAPAPCTLFPASNVWNRDVSNLPVAANSAAMIRAIGLDDYLHPDFDAVGDGIPYNVVGATTPKAGVSFYYADESDPGPYPIPANPKIEAGSDRHILLLDRDACRLYELYDAKKSGGKWSGGSGAIWDLRTNALRPAGWTSADAAGLPILPGLVLYSDVTAGAIQHAIRFTAPDTCGYIYPARHQTAETCSNLPPMGLRVRLKASVDISRFGPQARVVLTALKRYGMILADNGSPWYITGEPSSHWNDDELHHLQELTGRDFEVVDTRNLRNG